MFTLEDKTVGPLVSIIIPTYNRSESLKEALESALAQSYRLIEVLVIDDASTDDTARVVSSYAGDPRLVYKKNPTNLGPNANWRAGLETSRGEYFCFLADDDILEPHFVERLVEPMAKDEKLIFAFSDHYIIDSRGRYLVDETSHTARAYARLALRAGCVSDLARVALVDESVYIGAVLFRRSMVRSAMIDPDACSAIGGWLLYECYKTGYGGYYVPDRLMQCRWSGNSVSRSQQWRPNILKGSINRVRRMLNDPDMLRFREVLSHRLSENLVAYSLTRLTRGERDEAREAAADAIANRSGARYGVRLVYVLTCIGPMGARFARVLQHYSRRWNASS